MNHSAEKHHGGIGIYVIIFSILLVLTAGTVFAAFINFGSFNTVIALTIAVIKAVLVILFFMHLKESSALLKLLVAGAFVFVGVMIGMTFNDFATRNWGPKIEANSWIKRTPNQYLETPTAHETAPISHHA